MNAEELEAIRTRLANRDMEGLNKERVARALVDHIDSQDRQIATLKAALINDRSELILCGPSYSLWRYQHDIGRIESEEDWKPIVVKAKEELAREMPEIDWSDKQ